jgi:putative mRNA 3-end processing factor
MLDGGPALWYLNRLRHDGSNAILLTGYQAEGSGGRRLLERGSLPIFGKQTRIPLEIDKFDLSNHADHPSLCKFASDCNPSHVVLFHADESAAKALAADIGVEIQVHIPSNNDTLEIPVSW